MSRGLSTAIKNELAKGSFQMAHLVKLELNTEWLLTDAAFDITESSEVYVSNSLLMEMGGVKEETKLATGSLDLTLSGVNQAIISEVLNFGHLHRKVSIKRAFLDSNNVLIDAVSLYSGRVESMDIEDDDSSSVINLQVANHWADFERVSGRRTNSSSQQRYFPADLGFEFSAQVEKKLEWGKGT